jgi:hypothetical protein
MGGRGGGAGLEMRYRIVNVNADKNFGEAGQLKGEKKRFCELFIVHLTFQGFN